MTRIANVRGHCADFLVATAVLVALTTMPACATSDPAVTRTFDAAHNDTRVNVPPDTVFEIRLDTSPGTGFRWRVTAIDPAVAAPLGERLVPAQPAPAAGAPEIQVFSFRAGRSGQTRIEIEYARSWEKGVPPAKTYHLNIEVK